MERSNGKHSDEVIGKIRNTGIIPVAVLHNPTEDILPLCRAVSGGGIEIIEVTLRTDGAIQAVKLAKEAYPNMLIGVGTVTDTKQAEVCEELGADFIVTPGFDEEIIRYCKKKKITIIPGCDSTTDYQSATKIGVDVVKFFPAEQSGGVGKIHALSQPYPKIGVIPTGGITLDNLEDYIRCRSVIACGASYMVNSKLIDGERWDEISELCKRTVEKIKEARENG